MSHQYFFELLTEEIPAWMVESRLALLREQLQKVYTDFVGSAPASQAIRVGATSRRIYFVIGGLPQHQADREEEVKGPSHKAAYGPDAKPTAALTGFLRKHGATVDQVATHDDYVWLRRTIPGAAAVDALREAIPGLIEGLRWPKMMRWGSGEASFIRPIHSVISIFDGNDVPIRIFGIASGTTTRGHRILANREIEVHSYEEYQRKLAELYVMIDPDERVQTLKKRCLELSGQIGGSPATDEVIWDQWRYLTEYPGVVRAEFNPEYLSLPVEVLVTVMRVHQKQLPIMKAGRPANAFLAIMDSQDDRDGNVASGNGFVTNARFADARFFYMVDRKRTLADRLADLAHLQFQEKLGNYAQKTERVTALALGIQREMGDRVDTAPVREAAQLCKTDLVTEMVKEFTELQGKIGGIYAREEGKPEPVWQGIYDHYLPTSIDGELPRGEIGAIVSAADKLDTLCGFFGIGLKPTGSKDPFALRRAAQGLVQILLTREPWKLEVSLERLLDLGFQPYGKTDAGARDELRDFLAERVRTLLETARYGGFLYDEIQAVMEAGWSHSLLDLVDRAEALRAVRNSPDFLSILDSAKRIANITASGSDRQVSARLLEHPTEKRLASLADAVAEQVDELIAGRRYRAALESFAGMAPELEKFFVDVMVMVDDQAVRNNRMALLRKVGSAANKIADVTKVVIDRREYAAGA
jgi:glycyl-tRNA synthetase beta chain